jgi:hypothetical protein
MQCDPFSNVSPWLDLQPQHQPPMLWIVHGEMDFPPWFQRNVIHMMEA